MNIIKLCMMISLLTSGMQIAGMEQDPPKKRKLDLGLPANQFNQAPQNIFTPNILTSQDFSAFSTTEQLSLISQITNRLTNQMDGMTENIESLNTSVSSLEQQVAVLTQESFSQQPARNILANSQHSPYTTVELMQLKQSLTKQAEANQSQTDSTANKNSIKPWFANEVPTSMHIMPAPMNNVRPDGTPINRELMILTLSDATKKLLVYDVSSGKLLRIIKLPIRAQWTAFHYDGLNDSIIAINSSDVLIYHTVSLNTTTEIVPKILFRPRWRDACFYTPDEKNIFIISLNSNNKIIEVHQINNDDTLVSVKNLDIGLESKDYTPICLTFKKNQLYIAGETNQQIHNSKSGFCTRFELHYMNNQLTETQRKEIIFLKIPPTSIETNRSNNLVEFRGDNKRIEENSTAEIRPFLPIVKNDIVYRILHENDYLTVTMSSRKEPITKRAIIKNIKNCTYLFLINNDFIAVVNNGLINFYKLPIFDTPQDLASFSKVYLDAYPGIKITNHDIQCIFPLTSGINKFAWIDKLGQSGVFELVPAPEIRTT